MNRNITVLVYLEYHDENAARKTLDSVFEQQIEGDMQIIVCDLASALEEGIYDYSERDLIYIPVKEQMTRFDLEMALREQIESPYFTVIYDGEYFTDRKYLQRAVDFLDGEKDFSMYGSNVYRGDTAEPAYDLGEPKIILYNLQYRKYMIHGIEDYMYNLDLEGKSVVWIEAPMLVCRNNVRNEELQTISNQEELVREVFTRRRGLNLLYLKKGMCLLDQTVVAAGRVAEDIPLWKKYMQQALEVYALQYYYGEALSPKRIWDQIHFAYVKGSRELKKWEQQGNDIMTQDEQYLLDFMTTKCRKLWDPSPLWMQSCGERNPDQVFMILQIGTRGMGVFSTLFNFLGAAEFAEKNGAQVLVDLKNSYMYGLQDIRRRGRENAWEYYFRQPAEEYSLEEVYQSKNVMKCDTYYWCNPKWYDMFPAEKETLHKWGYLIRKYFRLTPELQEACETLQAKMLKDKRVLGICVRNNFALLDTIGAGLTSDHPRQPQLVQFIEAVHHYMDVWNCQYIYAVVDDSYALQELQKEFGECCIYLERKHPSNYKDGKPVADMAERIDWEWDIVRNNKEYICDTYLLSKCTSMLSGNCGCGRMAYYWNDGQYENVKVFRDGNY